MITTTALPAAAPSVRPKPLPRRIPPLENGAHLSASEFLRRYSAMPDVKKAELIQGRVYMASPVRADQHGRPDFCMQGFLFTYSLAFPAAQGFSNSTVRLNTDDVPQPDIALRLVTEHGGKSRIDEKGYLSGPPELIVEIVASSASYDLREKLETYRRAGVLEYIAWRTEDEEIDWFQLEEDEYRQLQPGDGGIYRSQVFPGLWLDKHAMLSGNMESVMNVLHAGIKAVQQPK